MSRKRHSAARGVAKDSGTIAVGTRAPVLSVNRLSVRFREHVAVADLSFDVYPGEVLAIVGESGSGKSVSALALMGLVELTSAGRVTSGGIELRRGGDVIALSGAPESVLRKVRGNDIAMIFQEPLTSLNPVHTVGDQIAEALRVHKGRSRSSARVGAVELMRRVQVPDPARRAKQYPHQMSGGMRQRIMIAMALACEPRVLIADEPTTALDVTVQAQILALLRELKDDLDAAVIFITHDMGVVAEIADRVLVMRNGRQIETGLVGDIFEEARHPYTRRLLSAVPRLGSMRGVDSPEPFNLVCDGE